MNKAITDYTQALKINYEDAATYYKRGITYYKQGKINKAIQDFKKVTKLYSEQGDTVEQKLVLERLKQLQQD
ncbi:MAG: tetratricopeptide repeat protein [Symploca sp. SIO2D2]|nr:tetratricopeptide repeat protein [Symploca sp. SIO2D2]